MEDVLEGKDYSFPREEKQILQLWDEIDAFKEQLRLTEGQPEFSFYDGPPFATGLPHYGHILAGTIKDIVTRYASCTGHHVTRRFGWDCHGLPVEYEIDKKLDIKSRDDVLKMGIDKYNEECRSIVMRYSKEWEKTVHRLGRWIDFENDYKTLDPTFMESVWWVFKQLYEKGLVYKGFKVMPFSTACSTSLSNFEAGLNYKDVSDPAVIISFPIVGDADGAALLAWTTTPWTLPSNLALCVNPGMTYVKVRDPVKKRIYILAESRLSALPGALPKLKKGAKKDDKPEGGFDVLAKMVGKDLVGLTYEPLFPYFASRSSAFRVVSDNYVTDDSGTGIVHQAPAFGEDDYRVCVASGIVAKGDSVPCPVDLSGRFTAEVTDFEGQHVKEADKAIMARLKELGRLVDASAITHSYPFCWRSETPLIYRAVPSWFVAVESFRDRLLANNQQTYWVPSYVKDKRFHNWLENARDWAISRSRFWGTPLPIWASEDGEELVVIGSIAELEEHTGSKVTDLHRHFIDHLTIPSKQGKGVLRRIDEVFDCWFESGSMPYAQLHYPFENAKVFEGGFPADFIAEGLDQTRGWFYTLMVLSTALFDKPAFKNLVCNGLVLASDGKKMSKRLKNYPDPNEVVDRHGADALRLYLINSPVVRAETLRFSEDGVFAVLKDIFLPWYNAYRFLVQNVRRLQAEGASGGVGGTSFEPANIDIGQATNVLDRWISASVRHLTAFVRTEMAAYRLYTVVPYLVRFLDKLTNIYVRYNRKRLKGSKGPEDCAMALATLFNVLLTVCKVMAPFTPFLTESMYQNLRRALPAGAPASVHFCPFPEAAAEQAGDVRIQLSVDRMQRVIELGRTIRDRRHKPLKLPLSELIVVHSDQDFLNDIMGELRDYVSEELNVRSLSTCADATQYCTVRAEPNFAVLAPRLGKAVASVTAAIKKLSPEATLQYDREGSLEVEGHKLEAGDIKVIRTFRVPDGKSLDEMDASGDGEVLVVLGLTLDAQLLDAGMTREIVNRFQKLRKKAGLSASDVVELYYGPEEPAAALTQSEQPPAAAGAAAAGAPPSADPSVSSTSPSTLDRIVSTQAPSLQESLGVALLPLAAKPPHAVVVASERQVVVPVDCGGDDASAKVAPVAFLAVIATPALAFDTAALTAACGGSGALAEDVMVCLAARDRVKLVREAEAAASEGLLVAVNGQKVSLQAGRHFFFSAGQLAAAQQAAAQPASSS